MADAGMQQPPQQEICNRLQRRMQTYRNISNASAQLYDSSIEEIYNGQNKQTMILKQRYVESKSKKSTKKSTEKKQESSLMGNISVSLQCFTP